MTLEDVAGQEQGTVTWFEADSYAAGRARARARAALGADGVDAAAVTQAELLVSELVTNVVRHTDSERVGLEMRVTAERVRVDVREDATSAMPGHAGKALADVPIAATSGRGLGLVEWLSTAWGITRTGRVTTTWFELALDGAGHSVVLASPDDEDAAGSGALLLRITDAFGRAGTAEEVADVVTRLVRGHVGAVFTGIALVDRDTGSMHYLSLDPLPAATAARWVTFPLDGTAPVSRVALDAEPLFHASPDDAEAAFPGIAEHMATAGTAAIAHLPLTSGGVTFGTLAVAWAQPREIDGETRALLLIVAGYAAQALDRR